MNSIERLIKNAKESKEIISEIALDNKSVKDLIINLNAVQQLLKRGVNIDDEIIGRYTKATELLSNGRKKEGSVYTFYDTGDFIKSFLVKIVDGDIVIMADTIKNSGNGVREDLARKYSGLLGLSEKSRLILKNAILEQIKPKLLKQLLKP